MFSTFAAESVQEFSKLMIKMKVNQLKKYINIYIIAITIVRTQFGKAIHVKSKCRFFNVQRKTTPN